MGQQVLDGDRQFAGPVAGGVVDRVSDRGRGAYLPDLADALDAERAGDLVVYPIKSTSTSGASELTGTR